MALAQSHRDLLARAEERVGDVLGSKWTLQALLGAGGVAAVYDAVHRNGKRVAIKILHEHLAHDAQVRERFLREAYVANSIGHPSVVQVDDDDVDDEGRPFLVMEYVDGVTLEQQRVDAGGTLAPEALLPVIAQLLDVLMVAHERGVVHRDLKPENLMLTTTGALRVLDFGLARAVELEPEGKLTQPGAILGTPSFMAPEQALGRWELVDERTDLWAVGAICFVALSGRSVHEGRTAQETLALAGTAHAPGLAEVAEVAPELAAFVDRALVYSKADRYPSAEDMVAALRDEVAPAVGVALPVRETMPSLPPAPKRAFVPAETSHVRSVEQADTVVSADAPAGAPSPPRPRSTPWLPIVLAALLGGAIVWGLMGWLGRGQIEPRAEDPAAQRGAPPPKATTAPSEIAASSTPALIGAPSATGEPTAATSSSGPAATSASPTPPPSPPTKSPRTQPTHVPPPAPTRTPPPPPPPESPLDIRK
jgi:serine/threonine-protein kinase